MQVKSLTGRDPSCERQEVIEKSEEAGSSTAERRHTVMRRDVAWKVGLRCSASHSGWKKRGFDLDSALLMHVVFPSGGQVLSWDACAA